MKDFSFFGVNEYTTVANPLDRHVEELQIQGYTILRDVLNDSELSVMRERIDEIYQEQVAEFGSELALERIHDSNNARCLLAYDRIFLDQVAANKMVLDVVAGVLGKYFILMLQNGVINMPQQPNRPNAWAYHRDLNYQHFTTSRPISISALYCIDDFSEVTGGTYILPHTQNFEKCPSEEYVTNHEQVVTAKAGSVIIFNSMMYHRSGKNSSPNIRRGINNMYVLPFIKQQISIPAILKGKYADDPFYNRFLGYESEPDQDVYTFRKKRIDRLPN
jgi:ectoine hydroxylase-related dioxygenase (phytanoyl-CoA dioxygenase family)